MASSYKIDFNDGTSNPGNDPIEVARDTRDTTSVDVTLFGRGTFNYGEELNENLLHLLEHFASAEAARVPRTATTASDVARDGIAAIRPATSNSIIHQPVPGQLWANKTNQHMHLLQNGDKWDSMLNSGDVTVNWGTILDGQTIPLPISATGYEYTEAECAWIVTPAGYGDNVSTLTMTADSRVVVAKTGTPTLSSTTANFLMVGIRDNVNSSDATGGVSASTPTLTVNTTSIAVSGTVNTTVSGSLNLAVVDNSGATVSPANLSFVWYRISDGAASACNTVIYDPPVRQDVSGNIFTFSATSQIVITCNPTWRVVATDNTGRRGEATVQLVFNFDSAQNELIVSTGSISYASAETNQPAEAIVTARITGGTGPYTVVWSDSAIDGSGAIKTRQDPPVTPPTGSTSIALLSDATYSLQRATAQTVFTRVSVTVTDAQSRLSRAFTTIRYNFIETADDSVTPTTAPLQMSIDGTLEGVYTIESSAYTQASAGADSRVFTLAIPVAIIGTAQGTQLAITRLRDTDQVQFNLISAAVIPNTTTGEFVFSIDGNTASNYPGTNSDAWRITFTAQDGRTISRDVITKFNYLTTTRPLTLFVSDNTVTAQAAHEATPAATYVTLTASPSGGIAPYSYLWNVSGLTASAPFTVVGPLDRPTLTLALRGTTFEYPEFDNVVHPADTAGNLDFVYTAPISVTVRDASQPSQTITDTATAGIKFLVDGEDMAITPLYNQLVTDSTYNVAEPYTMKGRWICNSNFTNSTTPITYETFQRVTLSVIKGSGSFSYTWVEETRAPSSTLTPVIVFPDTTVPNQSVYFKTAQTNCVEGVRFYEGVWRCDIVDLHTGATLQHREVVRIEACRATPGTMNATIQRVPVGVGFVCG